MKNIEIIGEVIFQNILLFGNQRVEKKSISGMELQFFLYFWNPLSLNMNGSSLCSLDSVRYLGVALDKILTFKHHIDHVYFKCRKP